MKKQRRKLLDETIDPIIFIDCCRYDLFELVNWIEGDLEKVWSLGSHTHETSRRLDELNLDRALISAHPAIKMKKIDPLDYNLITEELHWHPYNITNSYKLRKRAQPDSKYILWYVQPHEPFHGKVTWTRKDWVLLGKGIIGAKEKKGAEFLIKGFASNLDFILKHIDRYIEPPYVITSDHGEMLGENDKWAHQEGWNDPEVREVPWFTKRE